MLLLWGEKRGKPLKEMDLHVGMGEGGNGPSWTPPPVIPLWLRFLHSGPNPHMKISFFFLSLFLSLSVLLSRTPNLGGQTETWRLNTISYPLDIVEMHGMPTRDFYRLRREDVDPNGPS